MERTLLYAWPAGPGYVVAAIRGGNEGILAARKVSIACLIFTAAERHENRLRKFPKVDGGPYG